MSETFEVLRDGKLIAASEDVPFDFTKAESFTIPKMPAAPQRPFFRREYPGEWLESPLVKEGDTILMRVADFMADTDKP